MRVDRYINIQGKYELFAIGSSMGPKHATALVKQKDGDWYLFNDQIVEKNQQPPEIFAKFTTLLCYRKMDRWYKWD